MEARWILSSSCVVSPRFRHNQSVERGKICTLSPFGEEGGRIHRGQLFRNDRERTN